MSYYTPTIEEFHVGFEYEIYTLDTNNLKHKWKKFNVPFRTDTLEQLLASEFPPRVKYLDKEDIESLGFVFKKETESSYVKDNITIHVYDAKRWNTENDTITIFKRDLIRTVGKTIIFSGTIKNKSELKRLLKQLGI